MLYQWKFSVIDKDGNVLRQDDIIAPSAADADFIYKHNVQSWTYDEQKIFYYAVEPKPKQLFTGEFYTGDRHRVANKIQIDCLGEVEVKLAASNKTPVLTREQVIDLINEVNAQAKHDPDDDDPGLPPRTTNRHSGGRF